MTKPLPKYNFIENTPKHIKKTLFKYNTFQPNALFLMSVY
jgi:hypothetical protein